MQITCFWLTVLKTWNMLNYKYIRLLPQCLTYKTNRKKKNRLSSLYYVLSSLFDVLFSYCCMFLPSVIMWCTLVILMTFFCHYDNWNIFVILIAWSVLVLLHKGFLRSLLFMQTISPPLIYVQTWLYFVQLKWIEKTHPKSHGRLFPWKMMLSVLENILFKK